MEIIIKRSKEYWDNSFKKGRWDRLLDKEREKNTSFIARLILEDKKESVKVLDIGSGNGALADYLLPGKSKYYGVDISSEALNVIKGRHQEAVIISADINELEKIDIKEHFDYIVLNEVLYYIYPIGILRRLKRFSNKDTKVIISMYNSIRNKLIWLSIFRRALARHVVSDEKRGVSWTVKVFSYER